MRTISLIFVLLLLTASRYLVIQDNEVLFDSISIAFKTGDASKLSKYFNSTVNAIILEKEGLYKKNVVEIILKDFFNEYHTRNFIIRHQGTKNDTQYFIATLETEKGNFRVYILLKKVSSNNLIHRVQIESDSLE